MLNISPLTKQLIDLTLTEDLLGSDFSTDAIFGADSIVTAQLIAKEDLVLCGLDLFLYVIRQVEALSLSPLPNTRMEPLASDGDRIKKGTSFAELEGPSAVLLKAERVALNFLQQLSGTATYTRHLIELLDSSLLLCNTRKTMPGMRELQHYAVRTGGGRSHRFNLSGGVMLKDNHIAAAGSITAAIQKVRKHAPHTLRVEVECESLAMVEEAVNAGADIIMLDNMSVERMQEAVKFINKRALVEISGNIQQDNIEALRSVGADYVSSGAITHSHKAADISLRFNLKA